MIENPTPAKKKRVYVLIVFSSVYKLMFDVTHKAWSSNAIHPRLPAPRLIEIFLRFLFRMFCHFSFYSFLLTCFIVEALFWQLWSLQCLLLVPSPLPLIRRNTRLQGMSMLFVCVFKLPVMWPTFDCSAKTDKQDGTRPEYACHFHILVVYSKKKNPRRIKVKTEKAMYAEKAGVDGSGDLKWDLSYCLFPFYSLFFIQGRFSRQTQRQEQGHSPVACQPTVHLVFACLCYQFLIDLRSTVSIAKKATTATNQIARDEASPEVSDIEWPSTPV